MCSALAPPELGTLVEKMHVKEFDRKGWKDHKITHSCKAKKGLWKTAKSEGNNNKWHTIHQWKHRSNPLLHTFFLYLHQLNTRWRRWRSFLASPGRHGGGGSSFPLQVCSAGAPVPQQSTGGPEAGLQVAGQHDVLVCVCVYANIKKPRAAQLRA